MTANNITNDLTRRLNDVEKITNATATSVHELRAANSNKKKNPIDLNAWTIAIMVLATAFIVGFTVGFLSK